MLKIKNKIPSALTIGGKIVERIKMRNEVVWEKVQPEYFYIQNTYNGSNTVTIQQTLLGSPDSSTYAKHLQYSKDKTNWTTITLSSTAYTIKLNKGEKVYFRGNEGVFNYWYSGGKKKAITTISANQTHTVGGNINTILDYQDPYGLTLPQGAFNSIFENNTKLTSASDITFSPSVDGSLSSYCYLYLFKNCSNLTTVPKSIPAKKQGQDSCNGMFSYTAITTAPALPATTLSNGCYYSLFEGCSKLVNAPELPATEMKPNCYRSLFYGCTSLVNVPKLPATKMAMGCYQQLFRNCSKLVNAPALPATVLEQNCYQGIFHDCTSLVTAPKLPATTLATNCYQNAFLDCINLVNPPELPAKVLVEGCYRSTFQGCSKLNNITVYANDISATNCTFRWLYNVASEGIFTNYGSATYTVNSPSGIPTGWVEKKPINYFYIENTSKNDNTITFKTTTSDTLPSSNLYSNKVEYSVNKTNWNTLTFDKTTPKTITINSGEKLYLRNNSGVFNCYMDYLNNFITTINTSQSCILGGNINTLLNYNNADNVSLKDGCFYELFKGCALLTDASNLKLPSTTLANSCYKYMFSDCTSLTTAPTLPATTLANYCYEDMFRNCTSLISAPTLPATTMKYSCYEHMFNGCTSLTDVSNLKLPATKLADGCYRYMFSGCESLINTPTLPATTLADGCYSYMFQNCDSLTTAPALPATTLVPNCYLSMFQNCTSLTSAPALPAKTLTDYCYYELFYGCLSLNNITVYADDISAKKCTANWLRGVASSGTFRNLGSATYDINSPYGIPFGWTEVKN